MKKNIVILGSNNDIGKEAIDFFNLYKSKYSIFGISLDSKAENVNEFILQVNKINPKRIFLPDKKYLIEIEPKVKCEIFAGQENFPNFIKETEIDHVLSALSGITSVKKILSAIYEYKDITLLNTSPLLYSGKIIINEAKSKGVKLNIFSYPVYSLDFLNKLNIYENISKINLYSTKKNKEIDVNNYYNYLLFLKDFYSKNKIRLVNDMFLINYLYDLPSIKFQFYEQTKKLVNISINFYNGTSIVFNSNLNLRSIFNYYFLGINENYKEETKKELNELSITFSKIDLSCEKYLELGISCIEKGGSYPIIYYIAIENITNYIYNKKLNKNTFKILKEIVEDKSLYKKYPDLSSILSIEEEIIRRINSYVKK